MSSERRDNTLGWGQYWVPRSVPGPWQPSEEELKKSIAAIKSQDPANTLPSSSRNNILGAALDRVRGILGLSR